MRERDDDAGAEEADAEVDADGQRRQRAGERDVAERVAAEDLAPQHDEVADEPRRQRRWPCRRGRRSA